MRKLFLLFALAVGLLASASTLQAQVNMSRYITLTVANGQAIELNFKAAAAATPVRIVSGSNIQNITVGTDWIGTASYTAAGTTMTVYGDITVFDCSENGANLTALDASNNTELMYLNCSSNNLTTLDLSNNTQLVSLSCFSNNLTTLNVSNNTNLIKLSCSRNNLTTLDLSNNTQLDELGCSRNSLTTLDLSSNTQLRTLYCYANNFSTQALDDIYCALPDRTGYTNVVIQPLENPSDPNHTTVLATNKTNATNKNWKVQYYDDDTDIPSTTGSYVCSGSGSEPNMSRYITLTVASGASIKLDFWAAAAATPVRIVSGSNTHDITVGTSWKGTATYTADGTEMKVYGNLTGFDCQRNGDNITALDVSNNTQLKYLYCFANNLRSLDVSQNTKLQELICLGNLFTTPALDAIYCALPDRTGTTNGVIQPLENPSDPNHTTILATNAQNATAKNWNLQYFEGNADIPATTGTYECSTTTDISEASAEPALTLYPNPVADVLCLSATARTIRIYNIYGTEVAHAADTNRVEVAHLPAGVYTVRADGTVAKMVKR